MADIVLDKLTKRYPNGFEAVKDLSLEIAEAELLVLVGPSGCGKTTALRMIAGLEDIIERRPLHRRQARERRARARPRHRDGLPELRAVPAHDRRAEHRLQPQAGEACRSSEIRERVTETARLLGLEELLDRRPKQLSGGQRQRVAMGRAIVRQPQVFLMDEPLSNLDAQLRVHMRGEIESLQKRLGVTTVYVTHDQVEAMTMGDRVAVLRDGVLQQVDTPTNVYDRPANLFVAGFIGSPPMNLARGDDRARRTAASPSASASSTIPRARRPRARPRPRRMGRAGVDRRHAPRGPAGPARATDGEIVRRDACRRRSTASRRSARTCSATSRSTPPPATSAGIAAATGRRARGGPLSSARAATFCATFEPRSGVRIGDQVDGRRRRRRLHFFDPESERAIGT